jgi:hypothetical protein
MHILYFTLLFSLFVFVSTTGQYFRILTGQYFSIWTGPDQYNVFFRILSELRAIWQFMDRDVTHKILYRPKRSWGPYTILWMTNQSINCHLVRNAMHYLLYYTQYKLWMMFCVTSIHRVHRNTTITCVCKLPSFN